MSADQNLSSSEGGLKFTTYFRVFGDHAEKVEPVR